MDKIELMLSMMFLQFGDFISTLLFRTAGINEGNTFLQLADGNPNMVRVAFIKVFACMIFAVLLWGSKKVRLLRFVCYAYVVIIFLNLISAFLATM